MGYGLEYDVIVEFTAMLQESTRQRRQLLELLRQMRRAAWAGTSGPASVAGTGEGRPPPPRATAAPPRTAPWSEEVFPPVRNRTAQDYDYFRSLDERLRSLTPEGAVDEAPHHGAQDPGL